MKDALRDSIREALAHGSRPHSRQLSGSEIDVLPKETPAVTTLPLLPPKIRDVSCSGYEAGSGGIKLSASRLGRLNLLNNKSLSTIGSSGSVVAATVSDGSRLDLLPQDSGASAPRDAFSIICIRRLVALFKQSPVPRTLASSEEEMRSAFYFYSGQDRSGAADIPYPFIEAWRACEALWLSDIRDQAQANDRPAFIGKFWESIYTCLIKDWRLDPQVALELAQLLTRPSYKDFTDQSWLSTQKAAREFVLHWALTAGELGWHYDDMFGLDLNFPSARIDRRGLAWCLGARRRVIAMDHDGADLLCSGGIRQRFYRSVRNHCA